LAKTSDRPTRALGTHGSESPNARVKLPTKCSPLLQRCLTLGTVDGLLTEPISFAIPMKSANQNLAAGVRTAKKRLISGDTPCYCAISQKDVGFGNE